jgi:hypothetical protein
MVVRCVVDVNFLISRLILDSDQPFQVVGRDVSVSSRLLFFVPATKLMLLDATVYGLDRGSLMSTSLFNYMFHLIAGYLLLFFRTCAVDLSV